jgi:hypothetical protein
MENSAISGYKVLFRVLPGRVVYSVGNPACGVENPHGEGGLGGAPQIFFLNYKSYWAF